MLKEINPNEIPINGKTVADERIKLMFDAMPISCIYMDEDANIVDCNPEAIRMFGLSSKEEYIERFSEFIPEYQPCGRLSRDIITEIYKKVDEEGSYTLDWMHVLPSGPLPCVCTLVSTEHNGKRFYISYARDKRAEVRMLQIIDEERAKIIELTREQAHADTVKKWFDALFVILNGLDSLIYVTDQNSYEVLFLNDAMKKTIGFEGEKTDRRCHDILYGNDKPCPFCTRAQLKNEPDKIVIWEEHNGKINRDFRNFDRNIQWPDGRTVHLQHAVDITELREAERMAEQSSRSKSIFLTSMSHEIRTPMNAILGITEIQLRNKTLSQDTLEAFNIIYDSGSLLMNIINDILDLSKIEAGKLEIVPIKYDILSLVYDTVQLNKLRYESKPLKFYLDVDENTPLNIYGAELRIKQILNNILSNAFKYTDAGEVRLSVSAELGADMDMTIVFEVSDTGQGMSKDQIDRLYEDYVRFNMQTNRTIDGTGLGMSITKFLIDKMDGIILVESEPGVGSVFTVRLPQKRVDMAICGSDASTNINTFRQRSFQGAKINHEFMPYGSVLIVDDMESNIYVARGMLTPYGLTIDTAISGFEAIEKVKAGKIYDIIFMDHMMPQMDGIEATKIIHEWGYKHPIVALTANAVAGQEEMFLRSGFDAYLSKPIDSRDLNAILNRMIRDKQTPETLKAARQELKKIAESSSDAEIKEEPKQVLSPDEKESFSKEVEESAAILEEVITKLGKEEGTDFELCALYTITIQGIKNALDKVREVQLSEAAQRLEQAGQICNKTFIISETPAFLKVLRLVAMSFRL